LSVLLLVGSACGPGSPSPLDEEVDSAAAEPHRELGPVHPVDGPFFERSPPVGPPLGAELRVEARVPPAEFFSQYAAELGLGPKDEMRFMSETKD
jgi:hypothetical protein